jgi:hypothetical protein
MGHVKALEKTSCKYPIRRVEVKVDTVPRGNMNYVQDNMFLDDVDGPCRSFVELNLHT